MHRLIGLLVTLSLAQVPSWPRSAAETALEQSPKPAPALPSLVRDYLGAFGTDTAPVYVFENDGRLFAAVGHGDPVQAVREMFTLDRAGRAVRITINGTTYDRRQLGPAAGGQLKVTPVAPVAEVLKRAMTETPPAETGAFRPADLVELTTLDPTIHLEIRYATTNNFLGSKFYAEPRAFMQRPAAEAVARAAKALKPLGYGLLIHDGYRPWFVTKTFWDATPQEKKWLVADPSKGSKHNRGCAVDLTLYDLKTGRVIEMPSTYDESTERAYAFYPGGTSLERWHRALLRRVMEAEGFAVNPEEWWHFDYKDWQQYAIGNVPFDKIRTP